MQRDHRALDKNHHESDRRLCGGFCPEANRRGKQAAVSRIDV